MTDAPPAVPAGSCALCHTAAVAPSPAALDYVRGRVPLYTIAGAARLLEVPPSTFATWVNGYERPRPGRPPVVGAGMITRISVPGHRPSIPFVGLVEGYSLAAFRRQKHIPLPQVRRGVAALESGLKLEHGLASRHLYSVGARLLYDYAQTRGDVDLMDLVELDAGQAVFAPLVRDYLQRIVFDEDGWPARVRLPGYEVANVWVEPYLASGEPYFAPSGVPVLDVVGRSIGGDPIDLLSDDYGIPAEQISEAVEIAQQRPAA